MFPTRLIVYWILLRESVLGAEGEDEMEGSIISIIYSFFMNLLT